LDKIDKDKHYIRIKTHNIVVFKVLKKKSDVKYFICVRLISYNHNPYYVKYKSIKTRPPFIVKEFNF